jgi:streptogramin lyase
VPRVSGLKEPYGVAVGNGSVWVTEYLRGQLVRIDPATNSIVTRVPLGGHAAQLVVQDGFVWVIDDLRRFIVQVDATSNQVVEKIPTFDLRPAGLAGSSGSVWVTLGSSANLNRAAPILSELVRIDTATKAKTIIMIDGLAAGVTVGGGAVWVSTILLEPMSVFRIDPATNRVVARVETGHAISGPLAFGDSALWVANNDGYLTRIDSRSNKVTGNFELGSPEWAAMLAVEKDLWISAPLDNILARFDPTIGAVASTVRAGGRPQVFALLGSDVWVANYLDGTVTKLPIN